MMRTTPERYEHILSKIGPNKIKKKLCGPKSDNEHEKLC